MPDAIELVRVVRINPEELDPGVRIVLQLSNDESLFSYAQDGKLFVDPFLNSRLRPLGPDEVAEAVGSWRNAGIPPHHFRHTRCRIVVGGLRGLELPLKGEVVLEDWSWGHGKAASINVRMLNRATLRCVSLISHSSESELVA